MTTQRIYFRRQQRSSFCINAKLLSPSPDPYILTPSTLLHSLNFLYSPTSLIRLIPCHPAESSRLVSSNVLAKSSPFPYNFTTLDSFVVDTYITSQITSSSISSGSALSLLYGMYFFPHFRSSSSCFYLSCSIIVHLVSHCIFSAHPYSLVPSPQSTPSSFLSNQTSSHSIRNPCAADGSSSSSSFIHQHSSRNLQRALDTMNLNPRYDLSSSKSMYINIYTTPTVPSIDHSP